MTEAIKSTCIAPLLEEQELGVVLAFYSPGMHMPAHAHSAHQISYLLAGSLVETVGTAQIAMCSPSAGIKHAGVVHDTTVGPSGALILSVNVNSETPKEAIPETTWAWMPQMQMTSRPNCRHAIVEMTNDPQANRAELAWDLIAAFDDNRTTQNSAPPWLDQVQEQICDEPECSEMAEIARSHGVHPGHLSRAFKGQFGISPSRYRTHVKLMRGVSNLMDGRRPAEAAAASGFSDQAHFTRTLEREFGVPPRRFAALFAA